MKLRTLTAYSDRLLKGRRIRAVPVCLILIGTELFFRLAEASLYCLILYFSGMQPAGLFTGDNIIQLSVSCGTAILRCLTTAPLLYAAAYRFTELCGDMPELRRSSIRRLVFSRRNYGRALWSVILSKAVSVLFLIPAAFFGGTTLSLVRAGIENTGGLHLLTAVHAFVLTLLSVGLWLWAKTALLAVPFMLVRLPHKRIHSIIRQSFRFMKGRRTIFIKILALYITLMLTLFTIPIVLPKLFAALSLCISISLKEEEYLERNKADRKYGQACDASKLPYGTAGRFKKAAY